MCLDNSEVVHEVEAVTTVPEVAMIPQVPEMADGASPAPVPTADAVEGKSVPDESSSNVGPSSVYRVCQDVIEVKRHRRLPHAKRGEYVACVVSEIKNRLGCPAPNSANQLAVRRMAMNTMNNHGLRPSHCRVAIELVVAGVFVPDEADLQAAKILASVGVSELRAEVADAGPRSAWYDLFHPFKSRGAVRVRSQV